jgi:hypothetical protein
LIVAESADRQFVALSLVGGAVIVLDSTTGAQLASVRGDGAPIVRLAFDADGRLVIGRAGGRIERVAVPRLTLDRFRQLLCRAGLHRRGEHTVHRGPLRP